MRESIGLAIVRGVVHTDARMLVLNVYLKDFY
jgi:hypothetical protein